MCFEFSGWRPAAWAINPSTAAPASLARFPDPQARAAQPLSVQLAGTGPHLQPLLNFLMLQPVDSQTPGGGDGPGQVLLAETYRTRPRRRIPSSSTQNLTPARIHAGSSGAELTAAATPVCSRRR